MFIDRLETALQGHRPFRIAGDSGRGRPASVALITAPSAQGDQLLLIERARRGTDPWSGHLAFPGGRVDPDDPDKKATAERETLEEVGLRLDAGRYLGHLGDIGGASQPVVVSAHVYALAEPKPLTPEPGEVADAFWVPVRHLLEPQRWTEHAFTYRGVDRVLPAIDLLGEGRPVLWGLTYRFVTDALHLIGHTQVPKAW